jgi:hypothetical protein
MFYTDFFRFFRFDRCGDMGECTLGRRSILFISSSPIPRSPAYITNLFNGKVGICRNTGISPTSLCPHIHNDHNRSRAESLEQFRDFQIRRPESRSSMVESNRSFLCYLISWTEILRTIQLTIDFLEHSQHFLNIVQI